MDETTLTLANAVEVVVGIVNGVLTDPETTVVAGIKYQVTDIRRDAVQALAVAYKPLLTQGV